ncbi:vesicle-associated protein 1-2 [Phtheirospermum japonicum]|uniref:Vesicle-associated protein 1-2 n=1 Tax=Phtheirospermum japonicum TaxID=374723 RepID=A0A830B7I9_9LAMI|nr:vesicle-associated protein 1-2 [Phtheirospermum japonicum]
MSSAGELLNVEPLEMKFPFELKKQISCSLQVSNKTDNYVAFKVKTTNPKKYCVRPNTGIVLPRSTCDIVVTMQAQKEAPAEMQCKDKFLLQSVVASAGATPKDITAEMFNKDQGQVEECKLKVVYVAPRQPPSPVAEGSEEGFSPRASALENGNEVARTYVDSQDKLPEVKVKSLVSKLTEEKAAAIQRGNKLRQEMELLKRESNKSGGVSMTFVIIIGLLGIFNKDQGQVEECKLKVVYVAPRQPPSPVAEGSEEGFSPRASALENGNEVARTYVDSQDKLPEVKVKSLVSKLTEEKAAAIQRGNKLRQEMELLKRESNKSGGVSMTFVIIIGLLGIVLGYLMKRT